MSVIKSAGQALAEKGLSVEQKIYKKYNNIKVRQFKRSDAKAFQQKNTRCQCKNICISIPITYHLQKLFLDIKLLKYKKNIFTALGQVNLSKKRHIKV